MKNIIIQKFCSLCGQTKSVNTKNYVNKKLFVLESGELNDLGYMCDKCYKHLEDGKVFQKPKK